MKRLSIFVVTLLLSLAAASNVTDTPNLLFIVVDQMRYDALRFVQDGLSYYDEKEKILTPNFDKLASAGVVFETAYCQLPSCAAARTTLFTGCTTERTGVQSNFVLNQGVAERMPLLFKNKINSLESFEQLLVEERGYTAENYGKWHIPDRFFYRRNGNGRVISKNAYDFKTGQATFSTKTINGSYKAWLHFRAKQLGLTKTTLPGTLDGFYSKWPYIPITLDRRYGQKAGNRPSNADSNRGWTTLPFQLSLTTKARLPRKPSNACPNRANPFRLW